MCEKYHENRLGWYFRDHDFAMQSLMSLFDDKARLQKEKIGQAKEIIEGMQSYPLAKLDTTGTVTPVENTNPDSLRFFETYIRLKSGGELVHIHELQTLAADVQIRNRFWKEGFEEVVATVQSHLVNRPA